MIKPQAVSGSMSTDNAMIEERYTIEEVAAKLKFEPRTVQGWLKSGKLKGKKIGGEWRITEAAVKKFLGEPPQ